MMASENLWRSPPADLRLPDDEVHVWRVSLDQPASRIRSLERSLSSDERDKANRFYFTKDRHRFIAARGVLRTILGGYLQIRPRDVRFVYGPYGKPALADLHGAAWLNLNLSHSGGLAVYAFAHRRSVGIDLEEIRLLPDAVQIATRFFSSNEVATLRTVPEDLKYEAFFTCWTRKEAYIKARGDGLSLELDQFDVSCMPGSPPALLSIRGAPQEASRWTLVDLMPGRGYVGTLAVERGSKRMKRWNWSA